MNTIEILLSNMAGDANANLIFSGCELQKIVNIAPGVIELVCRKI